MGNFYSRQNEEVENVDLSFMSYRYPPKSGNYFSSHFIMGDQTFAGTQPECFLFGENSDLNFLSPRPVAFPYPELHKSEPTKMLRSLVNLRKDSLRLVKNKNNSSYEGNINSNSETYYVDFIFDADVRCSVTVHYLAIEDLSSGRAIYTTKDSSLTSRVFEFDKGPNQSFANYGKFHLIKPSNFKESELIYSELTNHIPVVIHIAAAEDEYAGHSNITMANIEKLSDGSFTIKLLKQKQMVDGLCYLLHEIYGLESKEEKDGEDKQTEISDDDYDEYADENVVCVVCMSDTRDTLMLPCKHLCVCSDCASSLRSGSNNCPICRVPFHALLQLCAYQRASTHSKSQNPYPGYEKVDLFDALNAFNIVKRRESAREIVRRVSARARSRSHPTTPKPSQLTTANIDKIPRRSSSRFSRSSHRRNRGDAVSESADYTSSRASLRSSTRASRTVDSAKSHVVELGESDDRGTRVDPAGRLEDDVDVGHDNLGMDCVNDEIVRIQGQQEIRDIDETSVSYESSSPYDIPLPGSPSPDDVVESTAHSYLPGASLDGNFMEVSVGVENKSYSSNSPADEKVKTLKL